MTPSKAIRRAARRIGVEDGADFDERRKIILREAARAFNDNGVENTSIEDIAKRLGVSKPAIYHYVPSKNDLITQCLDMGNSITAGLMQKAQAFEGNGLQKLSYGCGKWAEYVVTDLGRAMVLINLNSLNEESREFYLETQRSVLRRTEQLIDEGVADGSIRPCNTGVLALGIIGLFSSPAKWFREDGPLTLKDAIEELLSLMASGISN